MDVPDNVTVSNEIAWKPRVLVVENDLDNREAYEHLLKYWNYVPVVATGQRSELLNDAINLNKTMRCQLAVVDLKLVDHMDRQDESGLDLILKLNPTKAILVSGHYDILRNSIRLIKSHTENYVGFIGKERDPEELKQLLDETAQACCYCRSMIKVSWDEFNEPLFQGMMGEDSAFPPDEAYDLIIRLFPDANTLKITPLASEAMRSFSTLLRPKSYLLSVRQDDRLPVVVKLARVEKITQEIQRYNSYIKDRLVGGFAPEMRRQEKLWDIGGIIYTFLGAEKVDAYSNFFEEAQVDAIINSLNHFFSVTWSDLYRRKQVENRQVDLIEAYNKVWGGKWYNERLANFQAVLPGMGMPLRWQHLDAPEPKSWLMYKIALGIDLPTSLLAITHGDLHADNMLVDNHQNIWVVDFERTGEGPILQDFIELELDIIDRLAQLPIHDFRQYYILCILATTSEVLNQTPELPKLCTPGVEKAFTIISHLRKLAYSITGENDTRAYYWGLLLNCLFRVSLSTQLPPYPPGTLRAFMLASILSHRLDHWNQEWPPKNWPQL